MPEKGLGSLELESQTLESDMWALEIEPGSSGEQNFFTSEPTL